MNKIIRVGLLSLLAVVQVVTIIGGFFSYEQMSERMSTLEWGYKQWCEEKQGVIIDFGITPNPFAPIGLLSLFGLSLTVVLLIDQILHKDAENRESREMSFD